MAEKDSRRAQVPAQNIPKKDPMIRVPPARSDWFALAFGLFLGLAIVKFGNPVILEAKLTPPTTLDEFWSYPWPTRWSLWLLVPLSIVGAILAIRTRSRWPASRWLWVLPVIWFGWQLVSALRSVDGTLTVTTLWQFAGCLACYFLGVAVMGSRRRTYLLLTGLLIGFTFCLVRTAQQRLFEFPQQKALLLESERAGWTNLPPDEVLKLKLDNVIISTNGVDVVNPIFIAKYEKGRVHGTMVYPNALASVVLLLFPPAAALAFIGTQRFKKTSRLLVIALTLFLGLAGFFWSGSKSGWLIAMAMGGLWLFRLRWPVWMKWTAIGLVLIAGLVAFGVRFQSYFAGGATSVSARLDYWRAAVENTVDHPVFGSGPGTFQRPYQQLKAPAAEMARLAHNDFLEQFSDSGIVGGISYLVWISLLLVTLGRQVWKPSPQGPLNFALFIGILGWFIQGFSEFGLYIPALAWTAFTLAGSLLKTSSPNPAGTSAIS